MDRHHQRHNKPTTFNPVGRKPHHKPSTIMEFFALCECDAWLSNDSAVCMGVFDAQHLLGACRVLIAQRHDNDIDKLACELVSNLQLRPDDSEVGYVIKEITLNELCEIN